jgi:hypothetical protein
MREFREFTRSPRNQSALRLFKAARGTASEVPAWGSGYPSVFVPKGPLRRKPEKNCSGRFPMLQYPKLRLVPPAIHPPTSRPARRPQG